MHCSVLLQGVEEACWPPLMLWAFQWMNTEVRSALFRHQSAHPKRVLNFEKLTYRYREHHMLMGTSSAPWISGTLLVHGPFWVEEAFFVHGDIQERSWCNPVPCALGQHCLSGEVGPDNLLGWLPTWLILWFWHSTFKLNREVPWGYRLVFLAKSQPSVWDDTNLWTRSLSSCHACHCDSSVPFSPKLHPTGSCWR